MLYIFMWSKWRVEKLQDPTPARFYCTNVPGWLCRYLKKVVYGDNDLAYYEYPLKVGDIATALIGAKGEPFRQLTQAFVAMGMDQSAIVLETAKNQNDANDNCAGICNFVYESWNDFVAIPKYSFGLNVSVTMDFEIPKWGLPGLKIGLKISPQALKWISFAATRVNLTSNYFLDTSIEHYNPLSQLYLCTKREEGWQLMPAAVSPRIQTDSPQQTVNDKTTIQLLSLNRRMRPTGGYSSLDVVSVMMMDDNYQLSDSKPSNTIFEERDDREEYIEWSPVSQEETPFYFMSTTASFKKTNTGTGDPPSGRPPKFSNLDLFLGRMSTGSLVLASKPQDSKQCLLHESDELRQWLSTILEGQTATLDLTATFKGALIQSMELNTKLSAAFGSVPNTSFIFNATDNQNAFGLPKSYSSWPVVNPVSPDIVGNGQVLCLTVAPTSPAYKFPFDGSHILSLLNYKPDFLSMLLAGLANFKLDSSQGAKNAFWFSPEYNSIATLRLRFVPSESTKQLGDNIKKIVRSWVTNPKVTFDLSNAFLLVKKRWVKTAKPTPPSSELIGHTEVIIKTESGEFAVHTVVSFGTGVTAWILYFDPDPKQDFLNVVACIAEVFGLEGDIADRIRSVKNVVPAFKNIMVRRIAFIKFTKGWQLQISIQMIIGQMPFSCTINVRDTAPKFEFYGRLFGENRPGKDGLGELYNFAPFLPGSEEWDAIKFVPVEPAQKGTDVGNLNDLYAIADETQAVLPESPFDLRLIEMGFQYADGIIGFDATIMGNATNASSTPIVQLAAAKVDLRYSAQKGLVHFSIGTAILLKSPRSSQVVRLYGKIEFQRSGTTYYRKSIEGADHGVESEYVVVNKEDDYRAVANGTWVFTGSVHRLSGAFIYSLASKDCDEEMMQLLEHISLDFSITYTYTGKSGKSLALNGTLHLGDLQLHCVYANNGGTDWTFSADLKLDNQKSSLLGVVEAICGKDVSAALPPCIKNIVVAPATSDKLTSLTIVSKDGWLMMYVRVQLTGNTSVQLYQVQKQRIPGKTDEPPPPVKRVVGFTLDALPPIDNIPVVGSLSMNFTAIKFVVVSSGQNSNEGLIAAEVDVLNKYLPTDFDKLIYKDTPKKDHAPKEDTPKPALVNGFHFMIFNDAEILLDYLFGRPAKSGGFVVLDENVGSASPGLTPYNKKIGPVTITAVGLKFNMGDQKLTFLIDGSVQLGPMELSLSGFGVSFGFTDITLRDISKIQLDFTLTGLGLSFTKSPVVLAGYLEHSKTANVEIFQGGAALGFNPWMFQAGGYYALQSKGKEQEMIPYEDVYKCFMAYARLSGPIATIGYAQIQEVSGGLGYNTALTFPGMENIMNFPFISDPPSNPAMAIKALRGAWTTNKEDSNWIAVGLTVLAFQMLTVRTVVVVEWDRNVKLGLFGIATAEIPKQLDKKFARVQLGLAATIDFDAGVLKIDGQLTPASFILDSSCHLTGGFALYSWFGAGSGDNQGDWVFTIGGYHSLFQAKPQYPRPPRLGISWSFDANINISGEAYFAITPTVCMAGGRLHVSLTLGSLYAYFDAWADLLINYKPFHYDAQGGVSVGVRFTLNLWLVSLPIAIDIGAQLHLKGNPMSGTVHVDFWVFGFDVNFGHPADPPGPIGGDDFWKLVLQADTSKQPASGFSQILSHKEPVKEPVKEPDDVNPAPHIFAATSGLIPKKSDNPQAGDPWTVQGTLFALTITFKFPILTGKVITKMDDKTEKSVSIKNDQAGDMYARPMQMKQKMQKSNLDIKIERGIAPKLFDDDPDSLDPVWKSQEPQYSALPLGLWGPYSEKTDPNNGAGNEDSGLLNGNTKGTVQLMTGIRLRAPESRTSKDLIPAFDAELAMRQVVNPPGVCKAPADPSKAWEADVQDVPQYDAVKAAWTSKQPAAIELVDFWEQLDCFNWVPKEAPKKNRSSDQTAGRTISGQIR